MMRLTLLVLAAIAVLAGTAHADHGTASTESSNQVACDRSQDLAADQPASVTVDADPDDGDAAAVEACNDDADVPLQGRIYATSAQGGYVAADGDADNPGSMGYNQLRGWLRFNVGGGQPYFTCHGGSANSYGDPDSVANDGLINEECLG